MGISEQSVDRWKKVYGGLQPREARELKQLREENAKLKRLVAHLSLDTPGMTSGAWTSMPTNS